MFWLNSSVKGKWNVHILSGTISNLCYYLTAYCSWVWKWGLLQEYRLIWIMYKIIEYQCIERWVYVSVIFWCSLTCDNQLSAFRSSSLLQKHMTIKRNSRTWLLCICMKNQRFRSWYRFKTISQPLNVLKIIEV